MIYRYSKIQFDAAVKFLSAHNSFYLGQDKNIGTALSSHIKSLVNSEQPWLATMGFTISKSLESEDDAPEEWWIEINIDPAVSSEERFQDGDIFDSSKVN